MADNPFDPKYIGLLGALGGESPLNALDGSSLVPKPGVSPMVRAIANLLTDKPLLPVNPYPYGSGLSLQLPICFKVRALSDCLVSSAPE